MMGVEWHWAQPFGFALLLLLPLAFLFLRHPSRKPRQSIRHPSTTWLVQLRRESHQWSQRIPDLLRLLACVAIILCLARPQTEKRLIEKEEESLDLILALDLSESMRATDLIPNRLVVAKKTLSDFLARRPHDRLGLVVFSGTALLASPLTVDHEILRQSLLEVDTATVPVEGTAIGDAVLAAANRLLAASAGKVKPGGGRVIILATDGVNNQGFHPRLAAKAAAQKGIRLYTIGIGSHRLVLRYEQDLHGKWRPLTDVYGRRQYWEQLDETMLRKMAEAGGGRYFRAGDRQELERILEEIDRLEKNRIVVKRQRLIEERYIPFLAAAVLLLLLESILRLTRFRVWRS